MAELKPCPFCGSKNCLYIEREVEAWFIYCCNCHTSGPWTQDKQEAIEVWNKRS